MIKDFCEQYITLCDCGSWIITRYLITRWLYFSKIWFILKELMQNQALFDMFHVLRNERHYFLHILFRLNLRESKFSTIFESYGNSFLIHKLFAICSTHSETNIGMNSITMIVFHQNLVHNERAYAKPSSFGYVPYFTKWRTLFSTYFLPTKFKGSKTFHNVWIICQEHLDKQALCDMLHIQWNKYAHELKFQDDCIFDQKSFGSITGSYV